MKEAVLVGAMLGIVAALIMGVAALFNLGQEQSEKTRLEFKEACEAVHGTAVWNNKHWECLR